MADVAQPLLTVGTEHHDGTSLLWVRDNGHGIEPDRIRRIFEPFYTTKPVGKGTGLGLAISASLIENQGGRIGVRSDPGHGATFTIELPDLR
jgi:signal transduction histidine kinase